MKTRNMIAFAALALCVTCAYAGKRPNFIVMLTDDQRPDTLGCYDAKCPIETPNIDRLASGGTRFDRGFVTTPICVVSRACIITGRYETNARLHHFNVPIPDEVFADSYPAHLKKAGYFVGALGKYGVGVSPIVTKTFDVFEGQSSQGPKFREYKGKKLHDAEWLTVKTGEFLDNAPADKPFCLQVNYKEPHPSSVPAPEDDRLLDSHKFARCAMDSPEEFAKLPRHVQGGFGRACYELLYNKEGDINPYLRQVFEKIVSVDRSVGKIMAMLKERGVADNTVIIFLSDHGTHFGEKQLAGKWTAYEASLKIPFIVYDPRPQAKKGAVNEEMVLNIDVAPTLLDLAGVPVPKTMDGCSVVPLINGAKTTWRDHFFYEHFTAPAGVRSYIPRNVGVRTKTSKYVRWIDTKPAVEEFFDLAKDPLERNNVIDNPEYSVQVETTRKAYDAWRKRNPSTYTYDTYGRRAQYLAPQVDWEKFKKAKPKEYARIAAAIKQLGVTWEQAMTDWDIRHQVGKLACFWY